jgi:hypothetical protein
VGWVFVKAKAHGLHFGEGLGVKRIDLNLNIDQEKVMKELEFFCTKRFEIYKELSKEVFNCWIKEAKGCNDS